MFFKIFRDRQYFSGIFYAFFKRMSLLRSLNKQYIYIYGEGLLLSGKLDNLGV